MKFKLHVNYLTNLYTHLENLACYHEHTSSAYPKFFGVKNKNGLRVYGKLRNQRFYDREFEAQFTKRTLESSMNGLSKMLKKEEVAAIRKLLKCHRRQFDAYWKDKREFLNGIKTGLNSELNKININAFSLITSNLPDEINVFLCWNPVEFKATIIGHNGVLVELPDYVRDTSFIAAIVAHEAVHVIDWNHGKKSFAVLRGHFPERRALIICEAITEMFAPDGILTRYKIKGKKRKWHIEIDSYKKRIKPAFNKYIMEKNADFYDDFLNRVITKLSN